MLEYGDGHGYDAFHPITNSEGGYFMKTIIVFITWGICVVHAYGQINQTKEYQSAKIFQTTKSGTTNPKGVFFKRNSKPLPLITLTPEKTYQQIIGFGFGAFTQASASVLNKMSPPKGKKTTPIFDRTKLHTAYANSHQQLQGEDELCIRQHAKPKS